MPARPAARILLLEAAAIAPVLRAATEADFATPTICAGWNVREVVAHCAAALTRTASGDLHDFSPKHNQADVDARAGWSTDQLLSELQRGYEGAAAAIDAAGGALDGVGLGEWIHGGDIREALGMEGAYESDGIDLAVGLLLERSRGMDKPRIEMRLLDEKFEFGSGRVVGELETDRATFVRICGGRHPDPSRLRITGAFSLDDMVLFS